MALSIVVNGGGTFSASMEEGPVSFTASLGAVPGPQGPTGATGPTGVVAATAPILYDSGTQTVSIDSTPTFEGLTIGVDGNPFSTTINGAEITLTGGVQTLFLDDGGIIFPDSTVQTTAFIGEARKEILTARNNTGSTIAAGKVVYLSGATGNKPTVALALASSESTSARTIGITAEAIADNADGKVVISGAVENIDTSAFTAGDVVYLSSSTAGGLQTTLPAAPLHGVVIGIVTRANPSVGSIEVFVQNYQELQELSDVSVADRANNDGLFYNSSAGVWQARTIAEVLGYTPANNASLASYAPLASPTFTGTVTIPEGASISGFLTTATAASTYAPLASPTFTGDPQAPTPATSDNDTSIATTAFVNAYCPTASTTVAGKVELATNAEARTGTDTSVAVTPEDVREMLNYGGFHVLPIPFLNSTSTSGTGAGSSRLGFNGWVVSAPTSTTGSSYGAGSLINPRRGAVYNGRFNFSQPLAFGGRLSQVSSGTIDTNSVFRLAIGKSAPFSVGDIVAAQNAIMLKVAGSGSMQLLVANGTTLTTVTSSFSPTNQSAFDYLVTSDGSGNVTLYIDGSSVATTTAGPTTSSTTASNTVFSTETENTSSLTNTRTSYAISNAFIYTAG